MKDKEDHPQSGPNMSIRTWQDQEDSIEDLPATHKQNRRLHSDQQIAEQSAYLAKRGEPNLVHE